MLNLNLLVHKGAKHLPERTAWVEVSGFMLAGFGLFLGLATLTYNPLDYLNQNYSLQNVSNMAGPVGAWFAHQVLGAFGIVGMAWPLAMIIWGTLIIFGFAGAPATRRLFGFIITTTILATIFQIQCAVVGFKEPSFGFGGKLGLALARPLYNGFGYGGSLIALFVMLFAALVLTGNLQLSHTRSHLNYSFHVFIKLLRGLWAKLNAGALSEEELIKEALREELRSSKSLSKLADAKRSESVSPRRISSASGSSQRSRSSRKTKEPASITELAADALDSVDDASTAGTTDDSIEFYYKGGTHGKPRASMFTVSTKAKNRAAEFEKMAAKLTEQLLQFKIEGKVKKIVEGPVVTTYEFEPVPGTKVSKITSLASDLARLLQAKSLRILAPIPGKKVVGFEVPNAERRIIGFADFAEHRTLKSSKTALPIAMGFDAFGSVVIEDLAKMPHLLVAGSTGSGKSVFMNTLIGGLICRHSAKDLRFMMVDPKMVELAVFNDLPHMACPVITDPAGDAKDKLDALVGEMENRFDLMRQLGARNITGFNEIIKKGRKTDYPDFNGKWQAMPYIVLIIDELADMMMVLGKDAEVPITRLAQKARAAGIHLVIATQRPSADVVTGLIKANFPTRVAFRVLSGLDSRTILDTGGAEALIGQGDMLYLSASGLRRMHGAFLPDGEVHKMVQATKKKGGK